MKPGFCFDARASSYSDWKLGDTHNFEHGYTVALGHYDTNARKPLYTNAVGQYLGCAIAILSLGNAF